MGVAPLMPESQLAIAIKASADAAMAIKNKKAGIPNLAMPPAPGAIPQPNNIAGISQKVIDLQHQLEIAQKQMQQIASGKKVAGLPPHPAGFGSSALPKPMGSVPKNF